MRGWENDSGLSVQAFCCGSFDIHGDVLCDGGKCYQGPIYRLLDKDGKYIERVVFATHVPKGRRLLA